jgi:bacterioferritin-associated ferredoxin
MYVCICKAVTEKQVSQAVNSGVTTLRHLRDELGVTRECGRCARCALECMRATLAKNETIATVAHTGLLAQAA